MEATNANGTAISEFARHSSSNIIQNSEPLIPQLDNVSTRAISSTLKTAVSGVETVNQDERRVTSSLFSDRAAILTISSAKVGSETKMPVKLLPPPTNISVPNSINDAELLGCLLPAPPPFVAVDDTATATPLPLNTMDLTTPAPITLAPCASDFDSDTELSIVAAAATAVNVIGSTGDVLTTSSVSTTASSQTLSLATTNGHLINSTSSNSSNLSLNSKQQRQQKRRRERAQRLQAERDSRCNLSALSSTIVGGAAGVAVNLNMGSATNGNSSNSITSTQTLLLGNSSVLATSNGNLLYNLNSAGSMGEDSNNSNGNFTSSSNGSNNLLPPTDSIASLLLNPPHSPECNSGLMATPSDSEGESLDEDLLSTSSSSTLLLPRDKPPPRPPPPVRRKLPRSPVLEEEIIDGFAILEFKTYEDLEFAIKLGQKRKEKRLSALEELTCTYSVEEIKLSKVTESNPPHPLRTSNLACLTILGNNNLKEINNHHRAVSGTIVTSTRSTCTSISTNSIDESKNSSECVEPLPSICNAPDTHVGNWTGNQYGLQDPLSSTANIDTSNDDQIRKKSQPIQPETSDNNDISKTSSKTVTSSCLVEDTNDKLSVGDGISHIEIKSMDNKAIRSNSGNIESQNTVNNADQHTVLPGYVREKGLQAIEAVSVKNQLSVVLTPSSCQKAKQNDIKNNDADMDPTTALSRALALDIPDYTNNSVNDGASIFDKNNTLNKCLTEISNRCDIKESTTCKSAVCEIEESQTEHDAIITLPNMEPTSTLVVSCESIGESRNKQESVVLTSSLLTACIKENGRSEKLNVGISNSAQIALSVATSEQVNCSLVSSDYHKRLTAESEQSGFKATSSDTGISLNTKMIKSNEIETSALRSSINLSTSLTPVTTGPLLDVSFGEGASNELLAANINSNNNALLSIEGESSNILVDIQKSVSGSLPTSTAGIVNGLQSYSSVTSEITSSVGNNLTRTSPQSGNKSISIPITLPHNTVISSASNITKTSSCTGSSSLGHMGSSIFNGVSPQMAHLGSGLPMLIQTAAYRAPHPNFSIYAAYNNLTHGQYLSPTIPIGSSSTLTAHQRSDTRTGRDSATLSLKGTITTVSNQQVTSNNTGMRPITPLGYMLNNNSATQVVGTGATTTSMVVSSHHMPSQNPVTLSALTTGPTTTTSTGSIIVATSQVPPTLAMHMLPQSGYSSHLTSFSQFASPTFTQSQTQLRCSSTTVVSTNSTTVSNAQNSTSVMQSSKSIPSVIQKMLSPKSESRDRETNYSVTGIRPINTASVPSTTPAIPIGSSYCGIMPSMSFNTGSASSSTLISASSQSILSIAGPCIAGYPQKTGHWLNPSVMHTAPITCTSAIPIMSNSSARSSQSSGTVKCTGNAISPFVVHSSVAAGHSSNTNIQSTFLTSPSLAPHTSSSIPTSSTTISSNSLANLPLTSHLSTTIVTMTTATTTTSSVTTVDNGQSTVATVSTAVTPTPHPFSAESLFQPNKNDQADLLRRELDNRFLDRSCLTQPSSSSSVTYLRQELHHHQHQHTHLHQHPQLLPVTHASTTSLQNTPPTSAHIFPTPIFKDAPKITPVDPQFYRSSIGYTGYNSTGLLHTGLGGPTPFMPPNHLSSFTPKKTGRWNAMHVRIAWEIYYHQNKQSSEKLVSVVGSSLNNNGFTTATTVATSNSANMSSTGTRGTNDSPISANSVSAASVTASTFNMKPSPALTLSTSSHLLHRAGELNSPGTYPRSPFDVSPLSAGFIGAPPSHIGSAVTPFGRYVGSFGFAGLTHFGRDISLSGHLEAWRNNSASRSIPYHSTLSFGPSGWPIKADPALENARREAEEREREIREREQRERDRQRREREERERKEKEEKLKRDQQEREKERERERERKERERREIERREIERERILHQQRINESNKQSAAVAPLLTPRDRSPHRCIVDHNTEIRIKEEHSRTKDEPDVIHMRSSGTVGDSRYHTPSLVAVQSNAAVAATHHTNFYMSARHGLPSSASHITRNIMPPTLGGPLTHFAPPGPPTWGMDPYRDPFAPILRYNPLMEAALRHEAEERQKAIYAAQSSVHMRNKEPSSIPSPSVGMLGPSATHFRMHSSGGQSLSSTPLQGQQTQLSSIGVGKVLSQPSVSMTMISGDPLGHSAITSKKETEHNVGLVVSASGSGVNHSTLPGSIIGIPQVPQVPPSR